MELIFTIFGTTLEFRIGQTVVEEADVEIVSPHLSAQVEHFGFTPTDPAFPEFDWGEDEDV